MNYGEFKRNVLIEIGEFSVNGSLVSDSRNQDYLLSMTDTYNQEIRKIATIAKSKDKSKLISQYLPVNTLGMTFEEFTHTDEDIVKQGDNIKSYSFYAVGLIYAIVQGNNGSGWADIDTISETTTEMTLYNATIADDYEDVRILFTGTGYYNVKWVGLFKEFVLVDYKPEVDYAMDTDFYTLQEVVKQYGAEYKKWSEYKYDMATKSIIFNYYSRGDFKVNYAAYPSEIPYDASNLNLYDAEIVDLDPEYINALILGVAAKMKANVDKKYNIGDRYDSIGIDQLNAAISNQPTETENDKIVDVTERW